MNKYWSCRWDVIIFIRRHCIIPRSYPRKYGYLMTSHGPGLSLAAVATRGQRCTEEVHRGHRRHILRITDFQLKLFDGLTVVDKSGDGQAHWKHKEWCLKSLIINMLLTQTWVELKVLWRLQKYLPCTQQVGDSRRSTYGTQTKYATWFSVVVRRSTYRANGIPHVTKLCYIMRRTESNWRCDLRNVRRACHTSYCIWIIYVELGFPAIQAGKCVWATRWRRRQRIEMRISWEAGDLKCYWSAVYVK